MSSLKDFGAYVGAWRGRNRLHDPLTGRPDDSDGSAAIELILKGTFLRLDYRWAYHGEPQEGSLLIGSGEGTDSLWGWWIDTWHMGDKLMVLEGRRNAPGAISLSGSYSAPPGPDWGWKIELASEGGDKIELKMHNITPEGKSMLAVETPLSRMK